MTTGIPQPKADRTQLRQIIAGLPEGIIIINPDQTIAWANKAALAMHGVTALEELGATVSEYRERFELRYRNRHRLPQGEYPMERVIAGEAFSEVVVEVVRPGETRHRVQQIRSLVLSDPEGRPDCLVLVIEDETERFSAEERFERAFGANPAPALIVRLSDCRYVKVNEGFLELTGYVREALVGRSMHEIDVLADAEKRDLAVERLHAGRTIPQMEACLHVPEGEKTVILAGQPIEIGDEACMLFTFADLHPRKQVEHALRQSEQRFAVAFRMAPVPMAIIALDGLRLLDVNSAFTAATGLRREETIGRTETELGLWGEGPAHEDLIRRLTQTGHLHNVEASLRTRKGHAGGWLLSAETVTIHGERCVLAVMLNIAERKQTETELLAAIESVMKDTSWFGQKVLEKLASVTRHGRPDEVGPKVSDLTPRAREVLGLIAQGLADDEVASRLSLSRNTIQNHVSAIYRATRVRKRSALVVWARERGLGAPVQPPAKVGRTRRPRP